MNLFNQVIYVLLMMEGYTRFQYIYIKCMEMWFHSVFLDFVILANVHDFLL